MEIIASPTEQTTAATDLMLAVLALAAVGYLGTLGPRQPIKRRLWRILFGLLAIAGVLGGLAHGLRLSEAVYEGIWYPLNFLLILLVSLFGLASVYDWLGERALSRAFFPVLMVTLAVYASLYLGEGSFLWVLLYQGVVMLFALGSYFVLAWRGQLRGAWWMTAGLVVSLAAAGVQASGIQELTLIWRFDHNGLFHLLQMPGLLFLVLGLRAALRLPPGEKTTSR